ncbi:hypothetical protein GCM10027569_31020 [Flindersiella endophytica]
MALIATAPGVDTFRSAFLGGLTEYLCSGVKLPSGYAAALMALKMLSPSTLADDKVIADWLALLELAADGDSGMAEQYAAAAVSDQRATLPAIGAPCLVINFADDLVTPSAAGRECQWPFVSPRRRSASVPTASLGVRYAHDILPSIAAVSVFASVAIAAPVASAAVPEVSPSRPGTQPSRNGHDQTA